MTTALVPYHEDEPQRPGLIARIFGASDRIERLKSDHALARLAIEMDVDLRRQQRKAALYLESTKAEDIATAAVAKEIRRREILERIDDLFADDPITCELLKANVRAIFNNHGNRHHRRRRR